MDLEKGTKVRKRIGGFLMVSGEKRGSGLNLSLSKSRKLSRQGPERRMMTSHLLKTLNYKTLFLEVGPEKSDMMGGQDELRPGQGSKPNGKKESRGEGDWAHRYKEIGGLWENGRASSNGRVNQLDHKTKDQSRG